MGSVRNQVLRGAGISSPPRVGRWTAGATGSMLWGLIGTFAGGCSPAAPEPGPVVPWVDPEQAAPCELPLTVSPADPVTLPFGLVPFRTQGGSGQARFTLVEGPSGADLHATSGDYVAGALAGTVDRVRVQDVVCGEEVERQVRVVAPLDVAPRSAEVVPGTAVTLAVRGGSGAVSCALADDRSGATVTPACRYEAGAGEGRDLVRVRDEGTGQELDVAMHVATGHGLRLDGEGRVLVPRGARYAVQARHGSGALDLSVLSGPLAVEGHEILGQAEGHGAVQVVDRFTGEASVLQVEVLAPLVSTAPRDGERSGTGVFKALGDKDGDGHADALLGFIEISVGAHYEGAAVVYKGSASGLDPRPVQVFAGGSVLATAARGVEVMDADGDGEPDLLVGVDKLDRGTTNPGAVRIHRGVPGAFFEDTPWRVLYGEQAYDRLGTALVACDFDGDGLPDLAAGAEDATDRNVGVPAEDQGGVYVYRGATSGLAERPDFVLYGVLPEDAGWAGAPGLGAGASLAAGDFDGDGLCDLAVGAPDGRLHGGSADDGVVLVYKGTTESGLLLTREPVRVIAGPRGGDGELGRSLAAADLDDDGRAELLVTAWRSELGAVDGGAVHAFVDVLGGSPLDVLAPSDAAWTVYGSDSSDYLGSALSVADVDGDGAVDVIVGAYRAEVDRYGAGLVLAWTEVASQLVTGAFTGDDGTADLVFEGAERYDRFGQAVDVLGDVDGDGVADLGVLAGYAGVYGVEAGAPYHVDGRTGALGLLDLPGSAAGHDFARDLATYDLDGDGLQDLLVGAPSAADPEVGGNSGLVQAWFGAGAGLATSPLDVLGRHTDHSGSDRFGFAVSAAGDFDGDGYEDLAVAARSDSRPSSFDETYANRRGCAGARSMAGAVRVYRGGPDGTDEIPDFVWYAPEASGSVRLVVGGLDHDGDGRDDLVVASEDWGVGGGFGVVYGREADPAGTLVLCDADLHFGQDTFDRLGHAVAALGDLDADGCDEIGVGATGEEFSGDWTNQGSLRVLWGHGAPGCASGPEVTTLVVRVIGTGLGSAVAGGGDVDGDGVPDLVVGGAEYRVTFAEHGAAWLVPGAYVVGLPRDTMAGGALPGHGDTHWQLLLPEQGLTQRFGVVGDVSGGLFGESVALLPDPLQTSGYLVAVGAPLASVGGTPRGGGVRLYRFDRDGGGLDPVPWGVVAGEAAPGELGAVLRPGRVGGRDVLLVGAPTSDQAGLDLGAAYVVDLAASR